MIKDFYERGYKMVLFYVWTDIQIINTINVRYNFFAEEKADLLIFHLTRLSDEFIQLIKQKKVFDNIYLLDLPNYYLERKRKGIKEIYRMILDGLKLRFYFRNKLSEMMGSKRYDTMFMGAFWGESMNVYRYIRKYNHNITLGFIEEGLGCYNGPKNWLYHTAPNLSIKAKFRELVYYGFIAKSAKKYVKEMYIYCPELLKYFKSLLVKKIPPINKQNNSKCYTIIKDWKIKDIDEYNKRNVIYIADAPRTILKDPYQYINRSLDAITSCINSKQLLVRLHPLSISEQYPLNYKLDEDVYIDASGEPFELRAFQIDFNNKFILTNNSYVAYFLKVCMNMEPYIIFLHQICAIKSRNEVGRNDKFVNQFKKMYVDKNKIIIPHTVEELKKILSIIKR